ncbi:uncharacterized protein HMPREF1120_08473 [Exophiala dermatitidis NIH/UT8656]|uniref:Uncharacterized protein n=1 Tax=Exophiala dermatitidis (strain ATCC 34100 / CBS 525.76 / NIH/UT8656) TaxID=858893 RepID=H6C8U0_EXODN|nr:uncharacterized protein HMPREF1120_08473 [Exophiala dermatitidis NIH/UT8656]EHY60517.1 hypothetical protein HMPREF1120_08473 [Exophiala dermatitidis NIH/UT8656]
MFEVVVVLCANCRDTPWGWAIDQMEEFKACVFGSLSTVRLVDLVSQVMAENKIDCQGFGHLVLVPGFPETDPSVESDAHGLCRIHSKVDGQEPLQDDPLRQDRDATRAFDLVRTSVAIEDFLSLLDRFHSLVAPVN